MWDAEVSQVQLHIGLYAKSSYRGFLVAPYDSVSAFWFWHPAGEALPGTSAHRRAPPPPPRRLPNHRGRLRLLPSMTPSSTNTFPTPRRGIGWQGLYTTQCSRL